MEIDHDDEGVSIDLTLDEAEDLAVFFFPRTDKKWLTRIREGLHSVFAGRERYERRIRGPAAELRDRIKKCTNVIGAPVAMCESDRGMVVVCSWFVLGTGPDPRGVCNEVVQA